MNKTVLIVISVISVLVITGVVVFIVIKNNDDSTDKGDDDCAGNTDCAGVCGGNAVVDECGECGGSDPGEGYNCEGGCADNWIKDCLTPGLCVPVDLIGDGHCDDGPDSDLGVDLTCYDNDGGDCGNSCENKCSTGWETCVTPCNDDDCYNNCLDDCINTNCTETLSDDDWYACWNNCLSNNPPNEACYNNCKSTWETCVTQEDCDNNISDCFNACDAGDTSTGCVNLTMNMADAAGDGWEGATYTIYDANGNEVANGGLIDGDEGTDALCLDEGDYTIVVGGGDWDDEISWNITDDVTGYIIAQGYEGDIGGESLVTYEFTICPVGMLPDCSGDGGCCPEEWIGDGFPDCEDQAFGCDLSCYDNDGGDCDGDIVVHNTNQYYDASNVSDYNASIDTDNTGFYGDGYWNPSNDTGDYITFEVTVPSTANYMMRVRYALGGHDLDRPMQLVINGNDVLSGDSDGLVHFGGTNTWNDYANTPDISISLGEGENFVTLETAGHNGPNIDGIYIMPSEECFETGIDYFGHDVQELFNVTTPQECQTECQNNDDCYFWSHNTNLSHSKCWLKLSDVGRRLDVNRISGPKYCDVDA